MIDFEVAAPREMANAIAKAIKAIDDELASSITYSNGVTINMAKRNQARRWNFKHPSKPRALNQVQA